MATTTPANQLYCPKCRKTMLDTNFYTKKDGKKAEMCKACQTMHINNFDPETFLWLLEEYDVPYIESEWNILRDRYYQKDPLKFNGMSVFGRYLSKMKLNQWKAYTWVDTDKLKIEAEEKAKLYGGGAEIQQSTDFSPEKIKEIQEKFDRGEISEAEYLTYAEAAVPDPTKADYVSPYAGDPTKQTGGASAFPYPVNANPFEIVDIPDVGAELTDEDKIYLAMKWGRLYSASDWVQLEQLYKEYEESFDLHNADLIAGTKQLCKLDLKCNQALDSGDVDTYAKYSRASDALRKSLKFTEAQRKEEKAGEFDSVGQIVYFAEKYKGKIPRHDISTTYDLIDEKMDNLKRYNHDLIMNDTGLSQMFENYIKRKESNDAKKKDIEEAKEMGLERVEIKDEDYIDFNELLNNDIEEDNADGTE